MKHGKDISNELLQIAPMAQWPLEIPFSMPAGYFDGLPDLIADKILLSDAIGADMLPGFPPYSVPDNYFEHLPTTILSIIKNDGSSVQEELEELSPLLASIPRSTPFSLPENYFERISAEIPKPTPVIPIRHHSRSPWRQWAAAACVVAIMGTSALFFIRSEHHSTDIIDDIEYQLNNVSDDEIASYLQNHADAFDNEAIFSQAVQSGNMQQLEKQINGDLPSELLQKYQQEESFGNDELPNK
ncbi:hypothetical protein CLV59_110218 [Chitinophaga dinghuensis]|uniref:Uncharacterized protein n=2 Tax=Chitinophaga dinghuensis TaxID=1539050 RepID=A0A327VNX8_9BACT|nr:hypothetical protein CLV59_110218 [Chitinophaga dinghuensis]